MKNLYSALRSLVFCVTTVFCLNGTALSGSIVDPALSAVVEEQPLASQALSGSFKTKLIRSIRVSERGFLRTDRQDGFFDTLYIKNDLRLHYPTARAFPFLENSSFFENSALFFIFNYQRPMYASRQEIQRVCWNEILCFGNVSMGVSKPVIDNDRFTTSASLYVNVPVSKSAFDESLLAGAGASLTTQYKLFSLGGVNVSSVSDHYLDLDMYLYETATADQTRYNVPLNVFNQLGFSVRYSRYSFVPLLFMYGGYNFALNFKRTPFHTVSLHTSASWFVGKNIRVVVGLNWRDRILKPLNSAEVADTQIFHPDRTFFSLGGSYSF